MLLMTDSIAAAEHAHRHGLIDADQLASVRASTYATVGPKSNPG
jgi:hypothetical protein